MFGFLRLLLATMVVFSHAGVSLFGLSPGVMAVVVFYILAGYVVSHVYCDIIPQSPYKVLYFYKDRILRIFPLYLFMVSITGLFIGITGFGDPHVSLQNLLANLTIIPLNFYMCADFSILQDNRGAWGFIPPAWSLGTELQAYILLALVMPYKKLKYTIALITFAVYIIANYGYLHPDYFGYRLIVGVFFIFAIGDALHKQTKPSHTAITLEKLFPWCIWLGALMLYGYFDYTHRFSPTYTKETLIGLLVGIPLVYTIAKKKAKLPFDTLAGSLSYGLFLSHFLAIWILDYLGLPLQHTVYYFVLLFSISLLLSYLGTTSIEKPLKKYRIKKKSA